MRFIAFVTFAFLLAAHLSPAEDLAPLKKPTSKPRVIISTDAGGNDADDIRSRLRVHFIGSWNLKQDPFAFEYIDKEHPELFMIHDDTTFRGWYRGGDQSADLGNQSFASEHIADHGALGNLFASCHAGGVAKGSIKMGDTPTVAYLLRGKRSDPTLPHWGGQFVRHPQRPRWFIDDPSPESAEDPHSGARTVNRWRTDYLRDWQMRMDWCLPITRTEWTPYLEKDEAWYRSAEAEQVAHNVMSHQASSGGWAKSLGTFQFPFYGNVSEIDAGFDNQATLGELCPDGGYGSLKMRKAHEQAATDYQVRILLPQRMHLLMPLQPTG